MIIEQPVRLLSEDRLEIELCNHNRNSVLESSVVEPQERRQNAVPGINQGLHRAFQARNTNDDSTGGSKISSTSSRSGPSSNQEMATIEHAVSNSYDNRLNCHVKALLSTYERQTEN